MLHRGFELPLGLHTVCKGFVRSWGFLLGVLTRRQQGLYYCVVSRLGFRTFLQLSLLLLRERPPIQGLEKVNGLGVRVRSVCECHLVSCLCRVAEIKAGEDTELLFRAAGKARSAT